MNNTTLYVIAGLIVAFVVGYIILKYFTGTSARKAGPPVGALLPGWQFYSNPTSTDPPGTVFRIDPEGRRYIVDTLTVATQSGDEAAGTVEEAVNANVGMVARLVGLGDTEASLSAQKTERFEYGISDPVREYVSDAELGKVLPAFLDALDYRKGHRYFVIRETRKASAMRYSLTQQQVNDFGGKASVSEKLSAESKLFSSDSSGRYTLKQTFKMPMRVMFLPEEIRAVGAGLAAEAPQLGLLPVKEALHWEDAPQTQPAQT